MNVILLAVTSVLDFGAAHQPAVVNGTNAFFDGRFSHR
jgi:hypothetical protein